MSCCEKKRAHVAAGLNGKCQMAVGADDCEPPPPRAFMHRPPVLFEYLGLTAMTARGSITGRYYRFPHQSARVMVDARDAPGLAGVPNLQRLPDQ
ncbi:MAG: hypothetical protein GY847_12205 [Proteobacteria bacterium]|nr:hypothetical protein [Pseudomonadota bacterium]